MRPITEHQALLIAELEDSLIDYKKLREDNPDASPEELLDTLYISYRDYRSKSIDELNEMVYNKNFVDCEYKPEDYD